MTPAYEIYTPAAITLILERAIERGHNPPVPDEAGWMRFVGLCCSFATNPEDPEPVQKEDFSDELILIDVDCHCAATGYARPTVCIAALPAVAARALSRAPTADMAEIWTPAQIDVLVAALSGCPVDMLALSRLRVAAQVRGLPITNETQKRHRCLLLARSALYYARILRGETVKGQYELFMQRAMSIAAVRPLGPDPAEHKAGSRRLQAQERAAIKADIEAARVGGGV
jgi:hypothetical protein